MRGNLKRKKKKKKRKKRDGKACVEHRARGEQPKILDCFAPYCTELFHSVYIYRVQSSRPTIPNPRTKMLPSLPVKNSVLRRLGIADDDLPHGLARLKQNMLLPPHTPSSQGSNTCANSNFSVRVRGGLSLPNLILTEPTWPSSKTVWRHLKDTIAESPSRPDPGETFKSLSYLDQIALVCLAAGCHDCRAPDCLQYRSKLERVVPVCRSWPGLRDWVLCITSCVSRTASDIDKWRRFPLNIMYVRFSNSWDDRIEGLPSAF